MSATSKQVETDIAAMMLQIGRQARSAASALAKAGAEQKIDALRAAAKASGKKKKSFSSFGCVSCFLSLL